MNSVRYLFTGIYYPDHSGILRKGFLFIDEYQVRDLGSEHPVEYEFSEYRADYEYKAVIIHGFSAAVPLSTLPLGDDLDIRGVLGSLSREEIKRLIMNSLYRIVKSGITFPIIIDPYPDLVAKILLEKQIPAIIVDMGSTLPHRPGLYYIDVEDSRVYIEGKYVGEYNEVFCPVEKINSNCKIPVVPSSPVNLSCIIRELSGHNNLLYNGYKLVGHGKGIIDKGEPADLLLYDLRVPEKNALTPHSIGDLLELGYMPDTVLVDGDIIIEKGEALEIEAPDISDILTTIRAEIGS